MVAIAACLAVTTMFSGCNDDKENGNESSPFNGNGASPLVGKWHFVKEISDDGFDMGYGEKDDFIVFEKDGNFNLSFYGGDEYSYGTWKYSPPKLTMNCVDKRGDTETETSTVEKLTENELIYLTDWGMRFYYEKAAVSPDNNAGKNLLVGTWLLTSDNGYTIISGKKYPFENSYDMSTGYWKYLFKSNGTFEEYECYGEDCDMTLPGTWTYKDDVLTLSGKRNPEGGDDVEYRYNVKKMTATELVCEYTETNIYARTGTKTFTKIK